MMKKSLRRFVRPAMMLLGTLGLLTGSAVIAAPAQAASSTYLYKINHGNYVFSSDGGAAGFDSASFPASSGSDNSNWYSVEIQTGSQVIVGGYIEDEQKDGKGPVLEYQVYAYAQSGADEGVVASVNLASTRGYVQRTFAWQPGWYKVRVVSHMCNGVNGAAQNCGSPDSYSY